jgi:DNA-binding transcriptional MerR regulator
MRIGELAEQVGVNPRTLRFYESVGLLPPPERTPSGYRSYGPVDADRVRFIKTAQRLGLSLDDIREILAFRDRDELPCGYVLEVIDREADALAERIAELERLREELIRLRQAARDHPDAQAGRSCVCHIIEASALLPRRATNR